MNTLPKALSLSRTIYFGARSPGNASVIWCANHSAVGCRVTAYSCRATGVFLTGPAHFIPLTVAERVC